MVKDVFPLLCKAVISSASKLKVSPVAQNLKLLTDFIFNVSVIWVQPA